MVTYVPTLEDRYSAEQRESFYNDGVWLKESYYAQVAAWAEKQPDKVFAFDSTTSLTYAQLQEKILQLAVGLKRLGVAKGDRVLAQVPNISEFPVIAGATSRIGAVIVPVMPIYRDHDVSYVLENSGASVAFFAEDLNGFNYFEMFERLAPKAPNLKQLVALRSELSPRSAEDSGTVSLTTYESLLATGSIAELEDEAGPDSSPDELFQIVYTSGTTSRPKGCLHTLNTVRSSAVQMARELEYNADDVQFGPSPITHSTGLVTSVFIPLLVGASTHFMEKWDPIDGARRIEKYGLTGAVTATAFLQMLMKALETEEADTSSLRLWVCAGSPIPSSVISAATEVFSECQVLSLYGRSENLVTTMCSVQDEPARSLNSDGRAAHPSVVKVVGDDGLEVAVGDEGDIAYWGPSHMLGYWANEEATEELFTPEGFSRSGDLGYMDTDSFVRVTGRSKDIIIRGGMNISAREIEDYLIENPAIANVAVVSMPDERLGEKVCAYVVPSEASGTPDLETITEYLRNRGVATQKLPERLEVVNELPTTATGKIQKHTLRAQIAEKLKARVAS